jgi:hypothetical protein
MLFFDIWSFFFYYHSWQEDIKIMEKILKKNTSGHENKNETMCLSCGTTENMGTRRYCSIDCRQRLRYKLNLRTGLLKALNTRYATFYFTEKNIIMDILPYGSREIFSYIYPRCHGKEPAEDFCKMANLLGNTWWSEKKRTNKNYIASRHILQQANRNNNQIESIKPQEIKIPATKGASVIHLKLSKSELDSPQLQKKIKSAYRNQAKEHHPDLGGDASIFRKVQEAYEKLILWAENPAFVLRHGFPDKWFYDGQKNRWVQPTPPV